METNASRMIHLNGCNYKLWKHKMEDLLYVNRLHQPVFCSEKPESQNEEEWNFLHRQVCAYIRQWVDDSVLNHVIEEVNARTLWNKLDQLYAQKTCNNKLCLIKQLMGLRYREGTAMSEHLMVFQGIIDELFELGIKFNEEVQGLWFLGSLPESWETFRVALLNSLLSGVISMVLVRNTVLNEEMKRKPKDQKIKIDDEMNEDCAVTHYEVSHSSIPEVKGVKSLWVAYHTARNIGALCPSPFYDTQKYDFPKPFFLEIREGETFADVKVRIHKKLQIPPKKFSKLSFRFHSVVSPTYLKDSDVVYTHIQTSDSLYYVPDLPCTRVPCFITLEVAFHHAAKNEVVIYTITLSTESTVADIIKELKTKVKLSRKGVELRLLEIRNNYIYQIFPLDQKIESIGDEYWALRAEEIPEDQKNLGPWHQMIHVYHFTKEINKGQLEIENFGEPFIFVIRDDETFAEIKLRIEKMLHVNNEKFSKWKFAYVSRGYPRDLQDSDVVSTHFPKCRFHALEENLGLEYSSDAFKRSFDTIYDDEYFELPKKRANS